MEVHLQGIGTHLPERVVSNEAISGLCGLDPRWIEERTGITRRFLAPIGQTCGDMGFQAAQEALEQAGCARSSIGLVVVASAFSDSFPPASSAERVRARLGLSAAQALDVGTPLSGFVSGLGVALDLVRSGAIERALVIGSEAFSSATALRDRRTCYLFSDGAGAMVIGRDPGFARLDPVKRGRIEGRHEAADEAALLLGQAPLVGPRPEFAGELFEAALAGFGEGDSGRKLHVISQQLRESALPSSLPRSVHMVNRLSDVGHLLAASLPVSLYGLLRWGEVTPGERAVLFTCQETGFWSAITLEFSGAPKWQRESESLKVLHDSSVKAQSDSIPSRGADDLRAELDRVARAGGAQREALVCLGLRLHLQSGLSRSLRELAERETDTILRAQTRSSDSMYKLRGESRYALVLSGIEKDDAERLGERLEKVFSQLDLAGEVSVSIDFQAVPLDPEHPERFVDESLTYLTQPPVPPSA